MTTARKRIASAPEPKFTIDIELWTWEQAEEALKQNKINRTLKPIDLDKYARSMEKGLWGMCTDPIVFDVNGNLIDGQHRLHAQVKTQTEREWLVLRHVPPETQLHINIGKSRTAADQLTLQGHTNTIVLASVARWAHLLETGNLNTGRYKVSPDEVLDIVERHPDLRHSTAMGIYARTGFIEMNPTPIGAAHWWIAQHNDHAEADMFVDRFVHMNREPYGSPVLALMKRFADARRAKLTVNTRVQIGMVIKAWNYDVQRKYVSKINLYSRTGEFKLQDVLKREIPLNLETPLEPTDTPSPDEE